MIGVEVASILQLLELQVGDAGTWAGAAVTSAGVLLALAGLQREREYRHGDEAAAKEASKRSQAERVCAWYGGSNGEGSNTLLVRNDSYLPVYNAVINLVLIQGAGPSTGEQVAELQQQLDDTAEARKGTGYVPEIWRTEVFVVPPGTWEVGLTAHWGGMSARPGAEVAFRDAGGNFWARRANGALEELPADPFDHLNVARPIGGAALRPHP